jgi:hypothetical protein
VTRKRYETVYAAWMPDNRLEILIREVFRCAKKAPTFCAHRGERATGTLKKTGGVKINRKMIGE